MGEMFKILERDFCNNNSNIMEITGFFMKEEENQSVLGFFEVNRVISRSYIFYQKIIGFQNK